ncbi:purine-nucleoside phosphorylase [Desulfonispora thiosulfatigenes DSM 11270]|uniref:Purine nucleoside phosphorylase n=1 Tax=Desulfonispora thiosulfatigenes DSM 11270 TaxID=656914 RepID=A0A1W1VQ61_DESTI|nr:purine-nucleoside phosphorylase [Desulfonispora thiosulfatigenes]SMB95221.1 purine-nucleoside phosphorylase [Desulfonispora thiosulfatigenes DSM 11270]
MEKTIKYLTEKINIKPELGLILGSGLGFLAEEIENPIYIPYNEIPNFPVSTVEGHEGRLVVGMLSGTSVIAMQGRFHYYEGYNMEQVTFPIRVMQLLGVKKLLVTNAAGGINTSYKPGTIMIIKDHINLMGTNPLIGTNKNEFGVRFPDMSYAYNPNFRAIAKDMAKELSIHVEEGVYSGVTGPSYETPAEIKYLRVIGADAVGMSTVPETIVANHGSMEVLGISCITNMAAGVLDKKLDHNEVIATAENVKHDLRKLVLKIISAI